MRKITLDQFKAELALQDVGRQDMAVFCPVCKTVQSRASFIAAKVPLDQIEGTVGFSCIGRFTQAGPWKKDEKPGRGCNWTLGGLFRIHELEVTTPDNVVHPHFEIASKEQAQALKASLL